MQDVGQSSLTIRALQQAARHFEVHQKAAQHGQHALALPLLLVTLKALDFTFQHQLVGQQPIQRLPALAQGRRRQRGADEGQLPGFGEGAQPAQHFFGFPGSQHRIPVRQVHAFDAPAAKGVPDRSRFVAIVHQHGDVFGLHRL